MKWYTLQERPFKEEDEGLFISDNYLFIGYCRNYSEGYVVVEQSENCCGEPEYKLKDIDYWIPIGELKNSIPKED